MNNSRRIKIQVISDKIQTLKDELIVLRNEEHKDYDGFPEGFQKQESFIAMDYIDDATISMSKIQNTLQEVII